MVVLWVRWCKGFIELFILVVINWRFVCIFLGVFVILCIDNIMGLIFFGKKIFFC